MSMFFGLVCFAIAIIVPIWVVIYTSRNTGGYTSRPRKAPKRPKDSRKHDESQKNNHSRYDELVSLLNGDRKTADRLRDAYGVDRAIEDLIRDRR